MKRKDFYNKEFYENQSQKSFESAKEVFRELFKVYKPKSIVDFGCGIGTWLNAAREFGVSDLLGLDGGWVGRGKIKDEDIGFNSVDLEQGIDLKNVYDLAISLEVAEHLNQNAAETFIKSLCNASEVILFGAAIKGQGGVNHINEQSQSFWVNLFEKNDFECFDFIRPKIWNNANVEWWYRQNTFVFVKRNSVKVKRELLSRSEGLYDVIHPDNYKYKNDIIADQAKTIRILKKENCIKSVVKINRCKDESKKVNIISLRSKFMTFLDVLRSKLLFAMFYPDKVLSKYFSLSSREKLIMTILVRDEVDVIEENINFHLSHGVDFIIATDNGSVDGTREILEKFRRRGVLRLINEPSQDYSQAKWVNRMGEMAFKIYGASAVFHCDADEFWFANSGNLKNEIMTNEKSVLYVDLVNVLLSNEGGKEVFPSNSRYAVINPMETRNLREDSKENNIYLFRYPPKVIFKNNFKVVQGNHDVVNCDDLKKGYSKDIKIYHFPVRSKKHFFQKVKNGGASYESNKELKENVGWHWRRWFRSFKEGDLDNEYKKLILSQAEADKYLKSKVVKEFDFNLIIK